MALVTLGTPAANTLSAILYAGANPAADIAGVANGIKNDKINGNPIFPGAFVQAGFLFVPNRGVLKVLPGDYVAFDATVGWPILVSAQAAATGAAWSHT